MTAALVEIPGGTHSAAFHEIPEVWRDFFVTGLGGAPPTIE